MMKKILIVAAIAVAGITTAHAQVTFKPGVRAGLNLAKITQVEADFKPDFYAGIFGELQFSKLYSLQPELTYTRQGGAGIILSGEYDSRANQDIIYEGDVSLSYISLGAVNKLNLPGGINFQLGPTLDIITDSNRYADAEADLAFVFGIGYDITDHLTVEARVKKGIINVFESDYFYYHDDYYDNYNTNFLFQIGASYSFDLTQE